MFGFLKNKACPIALDIGSGSIRMLQLRSVGRLLTTLAGARWKFPPHADSLEPIKRRELVVEAIGDMLRSQPFKGRRVISTLSAAHLQVKNVRLAHMNDKELRGAVEWEAKERFSFDIRPDALSFINAGQVRQGSETRDEIIMIAAPPQAIDEHLDTLSEAGLRPEHVEAEPIAMFRSFERFLRRQADEQSISVVIDIGVSGTRVVVARGRQIVFIKFIDIGGRQFTDAVARQLNLSFEEACEIRTRIINEYLGRRREQSGPTENVDANPVNWTVHDSLRAQVEALSREIALCLRYCSVTFRGLRCEKAILTGGEAYDPAVVHLLSDNLGIECVPGQPLRGIDTSGVDLGGDRRGMLAEWAICTGMAVRGLDLEASIPIGQDAEKISA